MLPPQPGGICLWKFENGVKNCPLLAFIHYSRKAPRHDSTVTTSILRGPLMCARARERSAIYVDAIDRQRFLVLLVREIGQQYWWCYAYYVP